jgi:hypothetical protein
MKVLSVVLAALLFLLVSCKPTDEECKSEEFTSSNDTEISIE